MNCSASQRGWLLLATLWLATMPSIAYGGSQGSPSDGELVDGFRLPLDHSFFEFAGPVRARGNQWMTLELAALVVRAAQVVQQETGATPLMLGDASAQHGGPLHRHRSHRSGRDVDLLFYVHDGNGRNVPSDRFIRFDAKGHARGTPRGLYFDDARNWWLVRTLLSSQHPAVMWIFVHQDLKTRLLQWATRHGEHPEILRRARHVLHAPRDSGLHDDHFHVRIYCTASDEENGCEDGGPRWPWISQTGHAAPILSVPTP
jgi:penicillin-insensitive murein endopeptidase